MVVRARPEGEFAEIGDPKRRRFLEVYAEAGSAIETKRRTGIADSDHRYWLKTDEVYRHAFERAKELAVDQLEAEAKRRAYEGVTEPVFQGGKRVGEIQKYSDVLLIFLLKGALPERYRETLNVTYDLSKLSDEELAQFDQLASKVTPISAGRRRN